MGFAKWVLAGSGLIAIGFGASVAAQSARAQEPDVLSALLVEVRGLRQAMEQMASAGPRVQLALGRLQLQEQRVNGMLRRLESVRDSIGSAEKEHASIQQQVRMLEGTVKEQLRDMLAGTPETDHPMGHVLDGARKAVARAAAEIQRLQGEEAQIQQQIAAEQGRWSEINRTLEDLERALAKR